MSILKYLQESFVTEEVLTEVTAEEKYAKQYDGKLDREIFDKAVSLDPTSNGTQKVGQYVDWLIKSYKEWIWDGEKSIEQRPFSKELMNALMMFNTHNSKLDASERDINNLNFDKFFKVIEKAKEEGLFLSKKDKKNAQREKAEEESETVFNNENYIIVVPKTEHASRYYGAGSDWCTARQKDSSCLFNSYNSHGTLYIIYDKKTKNKFQLFMDEDGSSAEYKDGNNDEFLPYDEFSGDEEMIEWLKEKNFDEESETEEQRQEREDEEINDAINSMTSHFGGSVPREFEQQFEQYWWETRYEQGYGVEDMTMSERDLLDIDHLFELLEVINDGGFFDTYIDNSMDSFLDMIIRSTALDIVKEYIAYDTTLRTNFDELLENDLIDDITDYIDNLANEDSSVLEDKWNKEDIAEFMDYVLEHPLKERWYSNSWTDTIDMDKMHNTLTYERNEDDIYMFLRLVGLTHEQVAEEIYTGEDEADDTIEELNQYKVQYAEWLSSHGKKDEEK